MAALQDFPSDTAQMVVIAPLTANYKPMSGVSNGADATLVEHRAEIAALA
jgi:hypothetical protein